MLFNSFGFALFLPIVFMLYWFIANRHFRIQNIVLLLASYLFYGLWDYRFLFLLTFSILLDYYTGIRIHEAATPAKKKTWLFISISINLGFLFFFKYYNFFAESFAELLTSAGFHPDIWTLKIILPVGISFYTFHGLSYVIDIYKDRTTPTKNFVDYALFVSFFPLLVAGPIERATHLLPQVQAPREFELNKAVDGLRQILWGLFKKIVLADGCAKFANLIFASSDTVNGSTLVIGAVLFAFQIYGDFSGYSDIALGTARLFGFELLKNFSYPYFSRDIAEFWRRWHISLSSWFKDYVYIPLGGSRKGRNRAIINTFIIFLLSGFWHGANWTFIVWGGLNAIYFLPLLLSNRNRSNMEIVAEGRMLPTFRELFAMIFTFAQVVFAWIFFRADNLSHAFRYISRMCTTLFHKPDIFPVTTFAIIAIFLVIEWLGRESPYAIAKIGIRIPTPARWSFYLLLILTMIALHEKNQQFIYFQF
ncbi:MBOAT family O-acyltransferase [Chitinophaga pinensis]|uniref:MBOAT family protein n=1 Tax=Chitinophaga pinensis TaxID=79329 RepID=A0A5C6LS45_9BACT|nr:MBOAT family O-acyltransferase [Chitinophaga pinensis]TWV99269.1 MBOAT family protein [Chitinophaga pinensis]